MLLPKIAFLQSRHLKIRIDCSPIFAFSVNPALISEINIEILAIQFREEL